MKIKGFYNGCIKSGNIGDDIIFDIFFKLIEKRLRLRFKKDVIITKEKINQDNEYWRNNSEIGVIGGGTILHGYDSSYIAGVPNAKIPIIFGTGVLSDLSINENIDNINNGKFKELKYTHLPSLVNILNKINNSMLGGLRGPLSIEIIKEINKDYSKDFLYDAGILAGLVYKGSINDSIPHQEKDTIGINITRVVGPQRLGESDNESIELYNYRLNNVIFDTCKRILQKGYNISFFDMGCDGRYNDEICAHLIKDNSFYIDKIKSYKSNGNWNDLLDILSMCYTTIGTRLHASILSAAVGVPFIGVSYCLKNHDFAESIGLGYTSIPTCSISSDKIMDMIEIVKDNYLNIKNIIENHISKAAEKYNSLIDNIIICMGMGIEIDEFDYIKIVIDDSHNVICKFYIETFKK